MGEPVLVLDLPMPISVNAMYANVAGRGRVKTKRYRMWANAAGWTLQAARPPKVRGHFTVIITLNEAKRRGDADNRIKPVLDLLQTHGVVTNDALCDRVSIRWGEAPAGCQVLLFETADESAARAA